MSIAEQERRSRQHARERDQRASEIDAEIARLKLERDQAMSALRSAQGHEQRCRQVRERFRREHEQRTVANAEAAFDLSIARLRGKAADRLRHALVEACDSSRPADTEVRDALLMELLDDERVARLRATCRENEFLSDVPADEVAQRRAELDRSIAQAALTAQEATEAAERAVAAYQAGAGRWGS